MMRKVFETAFPCFLFNYPFFSDIYFCDISLERDQVREKKGVVLSSYNDTRPKYRFWGESTREFRLCFMEVLKYVFFLALK